MAEALAYAAGDAPPPSELELAYACDRYGAPSVFGRVLGAGEIRRMVACKNIVEGWRARQAAENMVEWEKAHTELAEMLNRATIEAARLGLI